MVQINPVRSSPYVFDAYRIIYNEQELVQLLRNGRNKAYAYLYENYGDALFNIILNIVPDNHLAADVLQDVFLNIYRKIDSYDESKSRLFTWMLNIAHNQSIDVLRSKSYKKSRMNFEIIPNNISNSFTTHQRTDTIGLKKLLIKIKPKYRDLIELNYFKGFTNNEIAQMMDIPLNTVKTRMRAALLQLRTLIED